MGQNYPKVENQVVTKKYMYKIIEVANTHGGSYQYLDSLLDEFEGFRGNTGIKFQPFKFDRIAIKSYEWYSVYQELFFDNEQWSGIIDKASKSKDVWLDIFDTFGLEVLNRNKEKVFGLKFQSSVLENHTVLNQLKRIDCSNHKLIINIAGRELDEILEFVALFESEYSFSEVLVEVGFQAYPTKLEDSGISKITKIKEFLPNRIVFADHISGSDINALFLPLFASQIGADVIEKHVMHSSLETKYDHFSAIKNDQFRQLTELIDGYSRINEQEFINVAEHKYLKSTIQVPILNREKKMGDFLAPSEFDFKRSNESGMNIKDIFEKVHQGHVLANPKLINETIKETDFVKLKVASIIAVRLKSSRLKEKAKQKIGLNPSIEMCIKNALRIKETDLTIVATSTTDQDKELENYLFDEDKVIFHRGDPDDVIDRYLGIIDKHKIDVIFRITGDTPYVSSDVASYLFKRHMESGADYTVGKDATVGTNLEIISTRALKKVKSHFPIADYSEYMTWYFQNNPEHFILNFVDLPEKWIRNYRLTLDYQEDLDMFNKVENYFIENGIVYSIDNLISFLDENPEISSINSHITLKFRTDKSLIEKLDKHTKIVG